MGNFTAMIPKINYVWLWNKEKKKVHTYTHSPQTQCMPSLDILQLQGQCSGKDQEKKTPKLPTDKRELTGLSQFQTLFT